MVQMYATVDGSSSTHTDGRPHSSIPVTSPPAASWRTVHSCWGATRRRTTGGSQHARPPVGNVRRGHLPNGRWCAENGDLWRVVGVRPDVEKLQGLTGEVDVAVEVAGDLFELAGGVDGRVCRLPPGWDRAVATTRDRIVACLA